MSDLKLFTLLERLQPGRSARARLLQWIGDRYVPDRTAIIQVYDHLGHYGLPGDRGHCRMSEDSGQWEVFNGLNVQLQQLGL